MGNLIIKLLINLRLCLAEASLEFLFLKFWTILYIAQGYAWLCIQESSSVSEDHCGAIDESRPGWCKASKWPGPCPHPIPLNFLYYIVAVKGGSFSQCSLWNEFKNIVVKNSDKIVSITSHLKIFE